MAVVIREPKASVVLAVAFWSYLKLTVGTTFVISKSITSGVTLTTL